jgi:hypothetical protein
MIDEAGGAGRVACRLPAATGVRTRARYFEIYQSASVLTRAAGA